MEYEYVKTITKACRPRVSPLTSISMLAPLSSNSLMMSQCPWWHATWRAVWPPANSSICAERKDSNPLSFQIFFMATKFKLDFRSFKKYPKLHSSHLMFIFLILLWLIKLFRLVNTICKTKGMKKKGTCSGLASKISLSLKRLLLPAAFTRPGSSRSRAWRKKSLKRLKSPGEKRKQP